MPRYFNFLIPRFDIICLWTKPYRLTDSRNNGTGCSFPYPNITSRDQTDLIYSDRYTTFVKSAPRIHLHSSTEKPIDENSRDTWYPWENHGERSIIGR